MGPDYVRPDLTVPDGFQQGPETEAAVADLPWWELFDDPVLQDLIETALEGNRDLRTSLARIAESRARLGIVRSDLYPRIDYSVGGDLDWSSEENGTASSGNVVLDVSYQVDLFGRIKRSNEAALNELLATEEAYRAVTISLVSSVAQNYFLIVDLSNRLVISERTVVARRKSLDVVRSRHEAGAVTEVDVNQAEIQVTEAEVSVQTYLRLRTQAENAMSVLLGLPPQEIQQGATMGVELDIPEIPTGLPSQLLNRRPDILAAERQLHAQTARIGVAEALKYPQLNLSGDIGAQASDVSTGFAGLAAQLFGPLFNAGANQRRVEVEMARTEQLLNTYEQSFLTALREVEDAMVAADTYELEYDARIRQLEAARNASTLSWVRYEGGLTSFLEFLTLQRSLFTSQLAASEAQQLRISSVIQLYQALGGGWTAAQDSVFTATVGQE